MRQLGLALAVAMLAGNADAGSYSAPVMEPEVIVEETETAPTDDSWVVAFMTFVVFATLFGN